MAYDEELAARVRSELDSRDGIGERLSERKMFGGIAFMVGGHMCCGVTGEDLMLRLGSDGADAALEEPHVRPMDFTGRPLSGFVYVDSDGIEARGDLRDWVGRALDFVSGLPPKQ